MFFVPAPGFLGFPSLVDDDVLESGAGGPDGDVSGLGGEGTYLSCQTSFPIRDSVIFL